MTMSEQEENDEINEEIEQGWRKIRENDKVFRFLRFFMLSYRKFAMF